MITRRKKKLEKKFVSERKSKLMFDEGYSEIDADKIVTSELKELAATHALDMIAGGDPSNISGMGDKATNSSLGPQWKGRRSKSLENEAIKMQKDEKGKEKMNVKLKKC